MIKCENGNIDIAGSLYEVVIDLSIIKLGLIDTIGEEKVRKVYQLSNKLVEKTLEDEIIIEFKNNLPKDLSKKLSKILRGGNNGKY